MTTCREICAIYQVPPWLISSVDWRDRFWWWRLKWRKRLIGDWSWGRP